MLNQNSKVSSIPRKSANAAGIALDRDDPAGDQVLDRRQAHHDPHERLPRERDRRGGLLDRGVPGVVQHAVADLEQEALAGVADRQVEGPGEARGLRPVEPDGEIVEHHRGRHRAHEIRGGGARGRHLHDPVAELLRGRQVEVAPGAVLGLVAELLQRVGLERAGLGVVRVGEHHVVDGLGDPAVLALLEVHARPGENGVGATHVLDRLPGALDGRELVERRRVAVEEAQVVGVDGLDVVADRAVVAAVGEAAADPLRELDHLGDLGRPVAVVREAERLVVDVAVEVALALEEGDDRLVAPGRPVVRREDDVGVPPKRRSASLMWRDQASASRTFAPRSV